MRSRASILAVIPQGRRGGFVEYVPVPVPEELVESVDHFLRWGVIARPDVWDTDATSAFLADLESLARDFILLVAEAERDGRILKIRDAAQTMGCSNREVLGMIIEVNEAVRAANGPPFFMAPESREPGDEMASWSVNLPHDIANVVLEAAGRPIEPA
jgi:hypothetical protein